MTATQTAPVFFCPITAGMTLSAMFQWEKRIASEIRAKPGNHADFSNPDSWAYKHQEIPNDWMCGGLYLLANEIARTIGSVPLKWDDGVFEYEHCAGNDDQSLWLPIINKMTADEWMNLCGNNTVPAWVKDEVLALMEKFDLIDEA